MTVTTNWHSSSGACSAGELELLEAEAVPSSTIATTGGSTFFTSALVTPFFAPIRHKNRHRVGAGAGAGAAGHGTPPGSSAYQAPSPSQHGRLIIVDRLSSPGEPEIGLLEALASQNLPKPVVLDLDLADFQAALARLNTLSEEQEEAGRAALARDLVRAMARAGLPCPRTADPACAAPTTATTTSRSAEEAPPQSSAILCHGATMRTPLLLQALMLASLGTSDQTDARDDLEVRLPPRRPGDPEPWRHHRPARPSYIGFDRSHEVEHPDWNFPRARRWGRACLVCKVEVDQGLKVCSRGHKPTKTRRVQLPK